ncbi:unnamed protein product [Heligmosomoides polygyrus]|uniref:PAM2 domain-containing protein n=1 Tax=Heligmosomoides polygyrus TaxID=6339 RepID=A0A183GV38_HELPZ|nr:unnamed protein product [Heligmosomoides polygyrus]
MVERANPSYDYIGFVDGRRVRPVTCSGDTEYCTEIEGRTIEHGDVARPTVMQSTKTSHTQSVSQNLSTPCTTATVSSAAGTNPMAGLMWPGTLGYNQSLPGFAYSGFPVNPAYLQHAQQQAMQEEKPTVVPQTVQEKEAELSSGTTEPVSASSSATQASNSAPVAKVPVASPPMECDSSVPSPPKTTATRSFVESPQPPRAPAPAPWDSTPSPRPRDYSPDRESTATRDTEKERDCEKDKEHREEKEKEKEEPREQVKKKPTKEVRAVASSQSRPRTKTNEVGRQARHDWDE